jgi:hypothetical protein
MVCSLGSTASLVLRSAATAPQGGLRSPLAPARHPVTRCAILGSCVPRALPAAPLSMVCVLRASMHLQVRSTYRQAAVDQGSICRGGSLRILMPLLGCTPPDHVTLLAAALTST